MSHTTKKQMAGGYTTCKSEKDDKRLWHRAFRRENRMISKTQMWENDEEMFPLVREKSDPWSMGKDGKTIYFTEAELRKRINSIIKSAQQGTLVAEKYRRNGWLLEQMCTFLNISQSNEYVARIKQKDADRFLNSFVKQQKKK